MAQTDSALSLLSACTGATCAASRAVQPASAAPPAPLGLAAQVVARWMNDPAVQADDGQPRRCPSPAALVQLRCLVAGVSRDVRPRAVLDELLRLGVVHDTEAGLVLEGSGFAPRQGFAEMSWLFAPTCTTTPPPPWPTCRARPTSWSRRSSWTSSAPSRPSSCSTRVGAGLEAGIQDRDAEAQQRFDADAASCPPAQRGHRARFGVYFYSEREE
jgi:hypothetical protein